MKTTYIALLRGINVGGHNVKMERLRELFTDLGFTNVRSYIQTGNVFFETEAADRSLLTIQIEQQLADNLGYTVPTFLRTIEELAHSLDVSPFKKLEPTPETRHLVVFISAPLPPSVKLPLSSPKGEYEVVWATPGEMFVVVHIQNGKFPSTDFLEKQHDIQTTGRFYHTAEKILEAVKNHG